MSFTKAYDLTIGMFVSMNVLMVPMIIAMTQIMQDLSNEDVHLPFQSNNCTHGLQWWNYVFIHTPK